MLFCNHLLASEAWSRPLGALIRSLNWTTKWPSSVLLCRCLYHVWSFRTKSFTSILEGAKSRKPSYKISRDSIGPSFLEILNWEWKRLLQRRRWRGRLRCPRREKQSCEMSNEYFMKNIRPCSGFGFELKWGLNKWAEWALLVHTAWYQILPPFY